MNINRLLTFAPPAVVPPGAPAADGADRGITEANRLTADADF